MLCCVVLCCVCVLCCVVCVVCAVLCVILHFIVLYCIVLYCIVLYCMLSLLYYIILFGDNFKVDIQIFPFGNKNGWVGKKY